MACGAERDCPQIGIRATVGLGKSVRARRHLLRLRERLAAVEAPFRIVVFTPSHALAEEAAEGWGESGLRSAVLRGYHATDRATGEPMCRDTRSSRGSRSSRARSARS